jgi:hypothetical protein
VKGAGGVARSAITMRNALLVAVVAATAALSGCASQSSYVRASDTTLGRVVVYRNGVAYFERFATIDGDELRLSVPADKVDDFLKSLTVTDASTGEPEPIAYPTDRPSSDTGLIEMKIQLHGPKPHKLKLTYVTEAPSWKPSYRVTVGEGGKVAMQAWAIVDNTSGEDWQGVKLGVGASSALSFRFDLRSIRLVDRETLRSTDLFAQAPPTGGSTYGAQQAPVQKKVLAELSDDAIAPRNEKDRVALAPPPPPAKSGASGGGRATGKAAPKASDPQPARPSMRVPADEERTMGGLARAAQEAQKNHGQIVVEGFADARDTDKTKASLDRANRAREALIRQGVAPDKILAVGRGEQPGQNGGVRVVEAPVAATTPAPEAPKTTEAGSTDPIGTSHFESGTPMSVPRGTSAMVSILSANAEGEVVYLYDAESTRGNAQFPFRSVRLVNPTDSALESGPVTVFGEGRFVGEGLSEPIPAHAQAFVPFALDRQIVVERTENERDQIRKIVTVQRGVFNTEVQHVRRSVLTLHNRLAEKAVVYVKHTVPAGYTLAKTSQATEKLGEAHLFRVEVPAGTKTEVAIEESTPITKTTDIRTPAGMELVRAYLSSAAVEGPLKTQVEELLRLHKEMADIETHIATMREQMNEYRARMDELHVQIVTLRAVKSTGKPLLGHLEKKLEEVSEKLSKATVDLVTLEERRMVARVKFEDGVAELSLDKK